MLRSITQTTMIASTLLVRLSVTMSAVRSCPALGNAPLVGIAGLVFPNRARSTAAVAP